MGMSSKVCCCATILVGPPDLIETNRSETDMNLVKNAAQHFFVKSQNLLSFATGTDVSILVPGAREETCNCWSFLCC